MKLKQEHKNILKSWGYSDNDISQIELATSTKYTTYTYHHENKIENISCKKAIELLGIKTFLSGISRSSFHWTSSRELNDHTQDNVSFDSRRLFY